MLVYLGNHIDIGRPFSFLLSLFPPLSHTPLPMLPGHLRCHALLNTCTQRNPAPHAQRRTTAYARKRQHCRTLHRVYCSLLFACLSAFIQRIWERRGRAHPRTQQHLQPGALNIRSPHQSFPLTAPRRFSPVVGWSCCASASSTDWLFSVSFLFRFCTGCFPFISRLFSRPLPLPRDTHAITPDSIAIGTPARTCRG